MTDLSVFDNDPTLYLYTSLTAGSSHIITATSRIETILKANRLPYTKVDTATNELARKLYGRRASGKKLPLLVKEGFVLGDLEQVEEWNEFGELKEAIGPVPGAGGGPKPPIKTMGGPAKPAAVQASAAAGSAVGEKKEDTAPEAKKEDEATLALRQAGAEAASIGKSKQDEKKAALLSGTGKATEAKTVDEPKDAAGKTPAETQKPAETVKPADTKEVADAEKPADPKKLAATTPSVDTEKPVKDDQAEKEAAKKAIQSEAPKKEDVLEEPVESYENLQKLSETTEHHRGSTVGTSEGQVNAEEKASSNTASAVAATEKPSVTDPADGDAEKNPAGALQEAEPKSTDPKTVDEGKTKALEEKRDVEDAEGRKDETQGKALDSAKKASKDEDDDDDDEGENEDDDEDEEDEDDEDEDEHEKVTPTKAETTKADTEKVETSKAESAKAASTKAEPAKAVAQGVGTKVKDEEPAKAEKAGDSVQD